MKFTLVSTVFNEIKRLSFAISDLEQQTLRPSEVIITDGGSTDGTYEALLDWSSNANYPIRILQKKGCNVAEGRNLAIRAAKNDLIVSTDFGCRYDKDWLKTIIAPFSNPDISVVGGAFGVIEDDLLSLPAKAAFVLNNGYNIDVRQPWFIPSSRSIAYTREVYNKVGGYCEWLTLAADDFVFGKQVKAEGYKIFMVEHKGVFWDRHKNLKGYVREAFRYGLGDGEARVNQKNFISNTVEALIRYCLFLFVFLSSFFMFSGASPYIFLVGILFLPGLRSYVNYTKSWLRLRNLKYNLKVFIYGVYLLEMTKVSYIKGYIQGLRFSTPVQKKQAKILRERLTAA
jgi:glycosyltransferase involved in cell wall biosynthesis